MCNITLFVIILLQIFPWIHIPNSDSLTKQHQHVDIAYAVRVLERGPENVNAETINNTIYQFSRWTNNEKYELSHSLSHLQSTLASPMFSLFVLKIIISYASMHHVKYDSFV